MDREELRASIAASAGITKPQADKVIQAFINAATSQMAAGQSLALNDFGKFSTRVLSARASRNPQTGAPIVTPAEAYAVFTPSQLLFDELN